jgi:DNA repair exonuclease SbcCD ATPase subunit
LKILALRLFNVRRFAGRGVAIEGIGDGVNVLCAVNEFGKSTSFEALHALFFQPHSGTPGDVQRLRPYSGGNPIVETDVATGKGHFRITKQYYGGRFARVTDLAAGRLVAQADEAENFIADLIRGGAAGPAGLLWVRQGVTGFERRSRSEEDSEKQVRASLLESVQGEVEAVTGGRRMAEIVELTEEALSELVTATGKARTGGRYATAIKERDRLVEEEERLAKEVTVLRDALDGRAAAMKRLAELDKTEERQERRKAIELAQAAYDAAKAQGEKLKTAEAELNLVRERWDAADRACKTFRSAVEKAGELQQKLADAEQRRSDAVERRRNAADAIAKAKSDADAAETRVQETRDLLARLEAALRAREAAERLEKLKDQLRRAEDARRALEENEAKIAQMNMPPDAIDELVFLELEIAKLRAVEEAARPTVAIAYQNDAVDRVTMDGRPLIDGQERAYEGQAQLSAPGIGTITLRSNRPAGSDDLLRQAETKRRQLLASMGVDNLAAARNRQVRAQRIDADMRELRSRLSLLAPDGLPELREEVMAREQVAAEAVEMKEDPTQVRSALAEAEERLKTTTQRLREAEPLRTGAYDAFLDAETELASLGAESTHVEAILGPEEERGQRGNEHSNKLDELARELANAEQHAAGLRAAAVDLDSVYAKLKRACSVDEAAEKEIGLFRETIAGLNAAIQTRSDEAVEEKWRETADALSAANARVAGFEIEAAVLQRLSSALATARSNARDLYLKPVMAELRPLLGLLFDDVSITFDEKTLLPQTILRNGQEEDVERLSGGMREQLSVLTRLAFARLLARDGRPAPVILDDALVYSDDDRIEKMFDALHRQSRDQQIIVFSCRQRAFQKLGGNILQMTAWCP